MRRSDLPRDELGRLRRPGEPDAMSHLRGLEGRLDSPMHAVSEACALFDQRRCFEAYRHFAAAWLASGKQVAVYRALAQAAAGLCHLQRGNASGAAKVLARAAAGIDEAAAAGPNPETPRVNELDLRRLAARLRTVSARVEGGDTEIPLPTLPRAGPDERVA